VYRRAELPAAPIAGPAVVEERECTSVVPPGCTVELDPHGNLTVTVETAPPLPLVVLQRTRA
jgi:N-methylhydantoinase A